MKEMAIERNEASIMLYNMKETCKYYAKLKSIKKAHILEII